MWSYAALIVVFLSLQTCAGALVLHLSSFERALLFNGMIERIGALPRFGSGETPIVHMHMHTHCA